MENQRKEYNIGDRITVDGQEWEITRAYEFRDFWDLRLRTDGGVLGRTKIAKSK